MKRTFACLLTLPLLACGEGEETIPTGDPMSRVKNDRFGLSYRLDVVPIADNKAAWTQQVFVRAQPKGGEGSPARIEVVDQAGCRPIPPKAEQELRYVYSGSSMERSNFYAFDAAQVLQRAMDHLKQWREEKREPRLPVSKSNAFAIVDVAVTAGPKPIYLVLAGHQNTLWNIARAPGADIAHITLISSGRAAIVNHGEAPVQFMTGAKTASCGASPARAPAPYWGIHKYDDHHSKEAVQSRMTSHLKFDRFFREAFGAPSETVVQGAELAERVLAGPPPKTLAERAVYKPVAGATIVTPQADHIMYADAHGYSVAYQDLVAKTLQTRLAPELAALRKP